MKQDKTIHDTTQEIDKFATKLTQMNAPIADEILLAREEMKEYKSNSKQIHLENAHKKLQLAKKIDQIEQQHQDKITSLLKQLESHLK